MDLLKEAWLAQQEAQDDTAQYVTNIHVHQHMKRIS